LDNQGIVGLQRQIIKGTFLWPIIHAIVTIKCSDNVKGVAGCDGWSIAFHFHRPPDTQMWLWHLRGLCCWVCQTNEGEKFTSFWVYPREAMSYVWWNSYTRNCYSCCASQ
jgi:hypothetical protein